MLETSEILLQETNLTLFIHLKHKWTWAAFFFFTLSEYSKKPYFFSQKISFLIQDYKLMNPKDSSLNISAYLQTLKWFLLYNNKSMDIIFMNSELDFINTELT